MRDIAESCCGRWECWGYMRGREGLTLILGMRLKECNSSLVDKLTRKARRRLYFIAEPHGSSHERQELENRGPRMADGGKLRGTSNKRITVSLIRSSRSRRTLRGSEFRLREDSREKNGASLGVPRSLGEAMLDPVSCGECISTYRPRQARVR